jgi:hypothetical protein
MYELLVLAAFFLGVIVLSNTREGLEPTQKIKSAGDVQNPNSIELEYRWSIASQFVKDELIKFVNSAPLPMYQNLQTPEEKAKRLGSSLIERFYENVYKPASSPITEANIDAYIQEYTEEIAGAPAQGLTPQIRNAYTTLFNSGALNQLLKAYYIETSVEPPSPPPVPEYVYPELPQNLPPQLNNVLDIYRTNYLEYRTTGQVGYKTAYEAAERYINNYMDTLRERLTKDVNYVNEFLDKYRTTNTDLAELQDKMKVIRKEGPKMEDTYLTIKKGDVEEPVDNTQYYVKGAVLAAIIGVVVAVSLF